MQRLRKVMTAGFVWVTALSTLIAGTPHFDCRCPNGDRKLFCLGFSLTGPGCCGEQCCAAVVEEKSTPSADEFETACPLCSQKHAQPAGPSRDHSNVSSTGCHRTWQQAASALVRTACDSADAVLAVAFVAVPAKMCAVEPTNQIFQIELAHHGPPPTDLIIALQHLTI